MIRRTTDKPWLAGFCCWAVICFLLSAIPQPVPPALADKVHGVPAAWWTTLDFLQIVCQWSPQNSALAPTSHHTFFPLFPSLGHLHITSCCSKCISCLPLPFQAPWISPAKTIHLGPLYHPVVSSAPLLLHAVCCFSCYPSPPAIPGNLCAHFLLGMNQAPVLFSQLELSAHVLAIDHNKTVHLWKCSSATELVVRNFVWLPFSLSLAYFSLCPYWPIVVDGGSFLHALYSMWSC